MEQILPDATFELVINLRDGPRKLFNRTDLGSFTTYRGGWLSGAHSKYIVIDTQRGASMIGAHFKPGGVAPFLPASAGEFHDQVVELESIWGRSAQELRERLLAAEGPRDRFCLLEQFLLKLIDRVRIDPRRQLRPDDLHVDAAPSYRGARTPRGSGPADPVRDHVGVPRVLRSVEPR